MNAQKAQSIFASSAPPKKISFKEDNSIGFKSTNESLVRKNLFYKQQLAQCTKTIEKLREENVELRQRNQELADSSDERKIELIVEQRVRNRLAHAAVLNKKLVNFLQQTGLQFQGLFKNIEPEPNNLNSKRMAKPDINLEKVDESPIKEFPGNVFDEVENEPCSSPTFSARLSSVEYLQNGTPKKMNLGHRGRRSELFQDFSSVLVDDTINAGTQQPTTSCSRRVPLAIEPSSTPAAAKNRAIPKSTSRRKIASVEKFTKPATPTPAARLNDSDITDTVRRQRSAKMNIKTMKEPSLGTKLRRPGKHDEPMPYIDTFF